MEPLAQILTVAIVLGTLNGILFLKSEWEVRARRLAVQRSVLGRTSTVAAFAGMLIRVLLALAVFFVVPLFPLELLGLLPLHGAFLQWFFGTYLVAICVGKLGRYAYWKWKIGGQLI